MQPLCFVLMPFGKKKDSGGGADIDFDRIYESAIEPAIRDADLEPIRADEERVGGVIHKAMFERLLLCEFAVADLTTANANVFYELGVRHATRPRTTVSVFGKGQPIAFDVSYLRSLPYDLGPKNAFNDEPAKALRIALAHRLRDMKRLAHDESAVDSPIYTLLKPYPTIDLPHLRSEAPTFRSRLHAADELRARIRRARTLGVDDEGRKKARDELAAIDSEVHAGEGDLSVLIDLYLAYRAVDAFDEMISLYEMLPRELKNTVMVREQLAFAKNRLGEERKDESLRREALTILERVRSEIGPNPETCGLIGRIHKVSWSLNPGHPAARGHLSQAIRAYVEGFEADWRDAYPGINALTLLASEGSDESLRELTRLLPVVRFSVQQRLREKKMPDYWDHATQLELAVHADQADEARKALTDALAARTELFQAKTTAGNLEILRQARLKRDSWLDEIIALLRAPT